MCLSFEEIALTVNTFSAIGVLIAAVAACRSARSSSKAVDATKTAAEAQLVYMLLNEYASQEMQEAVEELKQNKPFPSKDKEGKVCLFETSIGFTARRHVEEFFIKTYRLYKQSYIGKSIVNEILLLEGFRHLLEAISTYEDLNKQDLIHDMDILVELRRLHKEANP